MPQYNLLTDPIFTVQADHGVAHLTLPGLLAAYCRDEVAVLPKMAAYQAPHLHAMLVNLASLALLAEGAGDVAGDEEAWKLRLRLLTPGWPGDEPWCLVVEDPAAPAFFQPPMPAELLVNAKEFRAADDVSLLVTSKNHDVKKTRGLISTPEEWAFSLLSVQTGGRYGGRGINGISRMNSGFGSRPFVGLVSSLRPGPQWLRDTSVMLRSRNRVEAENPAFKASGGLALVWMEPWDGVSQLTPGELDPQYIEICRPIRLRSDKGALVGCVMSSAAKRINTGSKDDDSDDMLGRTGDPWAPVHIEKGSLLTVQETGWTYSLLARILLGGSDGQAVYHRPLLLETHPEDKGAEHCWCRAQVLVGGQCETGGWHERLIPIPKPILIRLGSRTDLSDLGRMAGILIAHVATMRDRVLEEALDKLAQGVDEESPKHRSVAAIRKGKKTKDWNKVFLSRFDGWVDQVFFTWLWRIQENPVVVSLEWQEWLRDSALEALNDAIRSLPARSGEKLRASSVALNRFDLALRKEFPVLFETFPELDAGPDAACRTEIIKHDLAG